MKKLTLIVYHRCSLAGRDLNRNYKSVLKDSFPSIWHTKMMIKRLNAERQVVVYCDLHGHSRKNNIFIYGCENKHDRSKRLQERVSSSVVMYRKCAGCVTLFFTALATYTSYRQARLYSHILFYCCSDSILLIRYRLENSKICL